MGDTFFLEQRCLIGIIWYIRYFLYLLSMLFFSETAVKLGCFFIPSTKSPFATAKNHLVIYSYHLIPCLTVSKVLKSILDISESTVIPNY